MNRLSDFRPNPVDHGARLTPSPRACVTISGSLNKHRVAIAADREEFEALSATVLSPPRLHVKTRHQDFVELEEDPSPDKRFTEDRHLDAIRHSNLLWLVTPTGYVGRSTAFELGYAHAAGVPAYARELPEDATLRRYVRRVARPRDALTAALTQPKPVTSTTLLLNPPEALGIIQRHLDALKRHFASLPLDAQRAQAARLEALEMRYLLGELAALPDPRST